MNARRPRAVRLRVAMSGEAHREMRALGRSAVGHLALVVVIVVADWLHRIPWTRPHGPTIRAGLAPAEPAPRRAPAPRPTAPRPQPTAARPVEPEPPEPEAPEPERPEPEPDLPGIEPPTPAATAPKPSAPRPRPRPASAPRVASDASAPAPSGPSSAPTSPGTSSALGVDASIEGWEGGPGDPYLDAILRSVSSKWLKPRTGLPARPAVITFRIVRPARVEGMRIESPSGSSLYDRAALRAVELATMPPLPPTVKGDALTVHFRFLP